MQTVTIAGVVKPVRHGRSLQSFLKEQTEQICAKLDKLLTELGSDKTHLLSARIYLSDMKRKGEMNEAWLEWIDGDDLSSRATIGGVDLGDPRRVIEVVVIAAKI